MTGGLAADQKKRCPTDTPVKSRINSTRSGGKQVVRNKGCGLHGWVIAEQAERRSACHVFCADLY